MKAPALHLPAKTQRSIPPPPHFTAFAWTEHAGVLRACWMLHPAKVLVPADFVVGRWGRRYEVTVYPDGSRRWYSEDEHGVQIGWMRPLGTARIYPHESR